MGKISIEIDMDLKGSIPPVGVELTWADEWGSPWPAV